MPVLDFLNQIKTIKSSDHGLLIKVKKKIVCPPLEIAFLGAHAYLVLGFLGYHCGNAQVFITRGRDSHLILDFY